MNKLICECWDADPSARPHYQQICKTVAAMMMRVEKERPFERVSKSSHRPTTPTPRSSPSPSPSQSPSQSRFLYAHLTDSQKEKERRLSVTSTTSGSSIFSIDSELSRAIEECENEEEVVQIECAFNARAYSWKAE